VAGLQVGQHSEKWPDYAACSEKIGEARE